MGLLLGTGPLCREGDLGAGAEGGKATELREAFRVVGEKLVPQREGGA